jgi:choline kinase
MMKALIFAAGPGTRISKITGEHLHKSLLELEPGKTVIENLLDTLNMYGIKKAVIVIGHLGKTIQHKLGHKYRGIDLEYVWNHEYATTNSGGSFYAARDHIKGGCWHFNADNVMHPEIVERLIKSLPGNAFMCDDKIPIVPEDGKITHDERGVLTEHGKQLTPSRKEQWDAITIGCGKLSSTGVKKAIEIMETDIRKWTKLSIPFTMCHQNMNVHMVSSAGLAFTEVDEEHDLQKAREEVYPVIKQKMKDMGW